jgi:hypothetical protein
MRIAIYVLVAITTGWIIAMSTTNFLLCVPLNAYWNIFYFGKQWCVDEVRYYVSFACIDLALDVATYILPLRAIYQLKLPRNQKLALMALFSIGILYGGTSIFCFRFSQLTNGSAVVAAALRLPSLLRVSSSYDMTCTYLLQWRRMSDLLFFFFSNRS